MKKLLGLTFVAVFMMSMASSNKTNFTINKKDCMEVAFNEMDTWLDYGFSAGAATCYGNAAYALCSGYSWQEIQDNGGGGCSDW